MSELYCENHCGNLTKEGYDICEDCLDIEANSR